MPVSVLIAIRGEREATVATALGSHPGVVVARRCADLTEALAAAHAGLGAVVVVSEQPLLDRAVVAEFGAAGVAVVGAPSSADAGSRLSGLGIEHVIGASDGPAAMASLVIDAAAHAPVADESPSPAIVATEEPLGTLVAVWGPTGAPGRTTLATNIAGECAELTGNALIVDVDTYGGAVAQALGLLDESPGIAALARGSLNGTLTDELIARHALTVTAGLRVLSGITRADRWPELSASALDPLWEQLRRHAAVTVVDCGFGIENDEELAYDTRAPQRNGATLSVLAAADVIVVVGSSEPLGVQRLVQALSELSTAGISPRASRMVVVNRVRASVGGDRPEESVADALRRYAGVESIWPIPVDAKACDAATLAGQLLRERAPRSVARKAIRDVAEAIVSGATTEATVESVQSDVSLAAPSRDPVVNLQD
jgi:MinD-like ATPase involved in chromosome partitioning or flagellar assembly